MFWISNIHLIRYYVADTATQTYLFIYLFLLCFFVLQASEMLLFNKKLTATQACELGLVTEVFPDSSFQSEVWTRLKAYAKLPPNVSEIKKKSFFC